MIKRYRHHDHDASNKVDDEKHNPLLLAAETDDKLRITDGHDTGRSLHLASVVEYLAPVGHIVLRLELLRHGALQLHSSLLSTGVSHGCIPTCFFLVSCSFLLSLLVTVLFS